MSLQIVITDVGKAALINAENTGTAPVEITEIAFGTGKYTASKTATALQNETKRLTTIAGQVVENDTVHVTAKDTSSDSYQVFEFGLFLSSGELFAVYSQNTPIIDKASASAALLAADIKFVEANPASVTFGDTSFSYPPATTSTPGVSELATDAETQAGSDSQRAVTPASLASLTASSTRRGLVELATTTETQAKTATDLAVTPAGLGLLTATTSRQGLVELATNDEAMLGLDPSRAISPTTLEHFRSNARIHTPDNNDMIGQVVYLCTTVTPTGYLKANGAAVSRSSYANLYAKIGTFWGAGNGSTTFNIPDLRGEFIRCWDDGRGVDSGRAFGSYQADEFKSHAHSQKGSVDGSGGQLGYMMDSNNSTYYTTLSATTSYNGGTETRPRNVALVAYIKY